MLIILKSIPSQIGQVYSKKTTGQKQTSSNGKKFNETFEQNRNLNMCLGDKLCNEHYEK